MAQAGVQELLTDLGRRMGVPGLRLDEQGACQLLFDQRWLVTIVHVGDAPCLGLHCPVTGRGCVITEPAMAAMLQGSFLGAGAGGGTLCIGPDQRGYLQRFVPLPADIDQLQRALELLLNHAESWAERLARPAVPLRTANPAQGWAMQRV